MKKAVSSFLALLFIVLSVIAVIPLPASAATTTPYYLTKGRTRVVGENTYFDGPPACMDMYMYGSSKSGTGTLCQYAAI